MSEPAEAGSANPSDWRSYLEELRQQGLLDEEQDRALARFFGERENQFVHEMQRIAAEYERRASDDGKDAATQWLTDTARAMGQRDREEIESLLSSMGLPLPERDSATHTDDSTQAGTHANASAFTHSDPMRGEDCHDTSHLTIHPPDPPKKDTPSQRHKPRPGRR